MLRLCVALFACSFNTCTTTSSDAMGDFVERSIIREVQFHVERSVKELGLDAAGNTVEVLRMGSREYGCADKTSNLDLYFTVPDDWAFHAMDIRAFLRAALEEGNEATDGVDGPVDQSRNCTLKWTCIDSGLDVSLLVAVEAVVTDAVSATKCLQIQFADDESLLEIVRETLAHLREVGVLNRHGRKATVGPSLKTAPAALLCVALMKDGLLDRRVSKDCQRLWLLRRLG